MKTSRRDIASLVAQRSLKAGGTTKKFGREVAAYLLDAGRASELAPLMRDIQADWAEQGYVEVLAFSAHPLDGSAKALIKARLRELYPGAKQIIITEQADPQVLGGIRLELADRQLDLSIEAKLNKFKQLTTGRD